jgi:hypothetical protein
MLCYDFLGGTMTLLAVLRFPKVDTWYHDLSFTMWAWAKSQANPHSSKQDTQPIVLLISKQTTPYRTGGGTCCPGCHLLRFGPYQIGAPLAMTVLTISTIPTIAQTTTSILTRPNHISTDGIPNSHKRHKPNSTSQRIDDLHDTHDCKAKQYHRDTYPNAKGISRYLI